MSSPTRHPVPAGPVIPAKPKDFVNGTFPAVVHDQRINQTVLGFTLGADESLTASITTGSATFQVAGIQSYDLVLETVDESELPPGHHGALRAWTLQPASNSDGATPLAAQKGQVIHLNVNVDVPLGTAPGAITGIATIKSETGFAKTANLTGTCLAVNVNSPIGKKWAAMGGEFRLGRVLNNEHPAPNGTGTVQEFANGALWEIEIQRRLQLPLAEVFYFSSAVWNKYLSLGTAKDAFGTPTWNVLGLPTEDTFNTTERGQAIRFGGGIIVARPNNQAWVVYGALYGRYAQFGNLADPHRQPFMGFPVSDEEAAGGTAAAPQRVSHFDGADLFWSQATGAHEVHGAIWDHWKANQWLGLPLTDETGTPDGIGRFNRFQNGMIYWTPSIGAHEVHGAILERWSALGYEQSYLGYPTSDETPLNLPFLGPGRVNGFQFGQITWLQNTGVVTELPNQVQQSQQVLTPSGTALGGTVTMTLKSNGDFSTQFHMHDSGATGYSFQVHAIWTTPGGLAVAAAHSGSVGGTFTSGSRDDDHTDTGNQALIRTHWADIQQGRLWVTKDYSATGVIGFVQDLAQTILDIGATAVGGAIGLVIGIGGEIGQVFGNLGIGGVIGVLAGVAVLAFGGGIVMAVVAGVGVGAVTNALIKQRQIAQAEYDFCNVVFSGSLPPPNKLILTNLSGLGGRAFTMPGVDGNIYLNMGDGFGDPLNWKPNNSYQVKGQVLVHELTHAWQIHHANFLPGFVCAGIVNQANNQVGQTVYQYGPPTYGWGAFNLEAQGAIVDQWFAGVAVVNAPNRRAQDVNDPYFGYIANNIRKGVE